MSISDCTTHRIDTAQFRDVDLFKPSISISSDDNTSQAQKFPKKFGRHRVTEGPSERVPWNKKIWSSPQGRLRVLARGVRFFFGRHTVTDGSSEWTKLWKAGLGPRSLTPNSLRVKMNLGRNLFQHISLAHPTAAGRDGLALFTHAPISELVYLLTGASVSASGTEGLYGLNGGENGWELWNRLCHEELLKVMKVAGGGVEEEAGQPPRGVVKKQKVGGEKKKPRAKKVVSASTAARKATVKAIRGAAKGSARKNAKK
ncbi:hypothetical protein GGX14DRAFT_387910 [Mycena pura]|uniref:Uncharacterized protein n=1 Tax=Mycena pura TaxID=153505 RepID=A0AAD6YMI2_9AGAR|nr:hypothetical protein GGX14DRAFT_387910 [Mycena pura]